MMKNLRWIQIGSALSVSFVFIFLASSPIAQETVTDAPISHLSRAIEFYHEGRFDEAFEETSAEIERNRFCALAYYYRARIRVIDRQYALALKSLEAAFRDSTGFTDATGLHAFILRETGQSDKALAEWGRFIAALGAHDDSLLTLEAITLPEDFREKLETAKVVQPPGIPEVNEVIEDIEDIEDIEEPGDPFPMPIIEFIEVASEPLPGDTEPSEDFKTSVSALSVMNHLRYIVGGGLILIALLIVIRRRSSKKQQLSEKSIEEMLSESRRKADFDDTGEQDTETIETHEEPIVKGPKAFAHKLKHEREQHRREIERLLRKL